WIAARRRTGTSSGSPESCCRSSVSRSLSWCRQSTRAGSHARRRPEAMATLDCDVCVVGAGAAGLSLAAAAVQMGARTVLIERGRMGGECLNTGCVPSKALIAAAHRAQAIREAAQFGVHAGEPRIDFAAVMAHVQAAIRAIAPNDSVERFEGLGVTVLRATARFVSP